MSKTAKKKSDDRIIAQNRKARHDYAIEECFEAGLVLEGWEIKSLREGKAQLVDSYVKIFQGKAPDKEAWLLGCQMTPLKTASTHTTHDPLRIRKLLLKRKQLDRLIGAVERQGYTLIALDLHWNDRNKVKLGVALCRGKKQHDKRATEKEKDVKREMARAFKKSH